MTPDIQFNFHDDNDLCDITITLNGKSASFHDLRVKRVNLRDYRDRQMVYQVFIPCAKVLERDYMLCCGLDAIKGFRHPEQAPIVFTPFTDDDESIDIPQRKQGKKRDAWQQMRMFGEGDVS